MLTPAHPLRSRFTARWHHRRLLWRARLCALLACLVLAGAALALRGWESRAVWQSEGQQGDFIGVPYMAEAAEMPAARPAARKVLARPASPPSALPALAVSADLPEPEPLHEQELVENLPAEAESFTLEADIEMRSLPTAHPTASRRAAAVAAEAPLTPPAYREAPKPPYPPSLRARRISGSVGVRIAVSAEGVPTEVTVTTRGAHAEFERTVRRWILEHWRFAPARRGDAPVAATVQTRVDFVLD